jgi:hypothetical protein
VDRRHSVGDITCERPGGTLARPSAPISVFIVTSVRWSERREQIKNFILLATRSEQNKNMFKSQRIRDPLHNLIEFRGTEFEHALWFVLQTRPFQRLRRIKQLGFSEPTSAKPNISKQKRIKL